MRYLARSLTLTASLAALVSLAACGDDTTGSGGSGTTSSSTTTSTTGVGTTGSTTSTSSVSSTSSSASTGSGGAAAADHLVISEIGVAPEAGGEFIEIYNPTASAIALSDVYISDNSSYYELASGGAWAPITNNPGTDFLARFPAASSIAAGAVLVIGFDPGYEAMWSSCPDFFLGTAPLACGGSMVPILLATEAGSVTDASNLSNSREMVVLFSWSGNTADTLADLDYVTWGATFEAGTRADKTGVAGYQADTAPASQAGAPAPAPTESIERCALEQGETASGGNGITGHDETSENLAASFQIQAAPTPGVKNTCLP